MRTYIKFLLPLLLTLFFNIASAENALDSLQKQVVYEMQNGKMEPATKLLWEAALTSEDHQSCLVKAWEAYELAQQEEEWPQAHFLLHRALLHLYLVNVSEGTLFECLEALDETTQNLPEEIRALEQQQATEIIYDLAVEASEEINGIQRSSKSSSSSLSISHLRPNAQKAIKHYLLPKNSPLRGPLDKIFSTSRVTLNENTFTAAGFTTLHTQPRSFVCVARHPSLPGHLVKVQLDSVLTMKHNKPDWFWFAKRCEGAKKLQAAIKKVKSKYFAVPQKWIYPLPAEPKAPEGGGYMKKHVVLVVEDMKIVSDEENAQAWTTTITPKHLDELYEIITIAKGRSYRRDNIPYTHKGKFAFIDTEYPNKEPGYSAILPALSPEMQDYWKNLLAKKESKRKRKYKK